MKQMNTIFIFCVIAFTLSIDYSLSLISLQAYWTATGGNPKLSGLAFGLYDGSTIVLTPLIAWLIYSKKITYRYVFAVSLVVNIFGNVVYSLAFLVNSWIMVLVGRGIAGMGASVLPLMMVYIADKMPESEQKNAVGFIKYISALSRVVGPILGSLFSAIVFHNDVFNLYTLVGWIPVFLGILTLGLLGRWSEVLFTESLRSGLNFLEIMKIFWPALMVGFVSTFIYWLFMGNIFLIATHYFHIVGGEHELGKLYYAGVVGFFVAFVCFLCLRDSLASIGGLWVSVILLSGSACLYLWNVEIVFHFAVGMTTFSYGLMIPSINILNNNLAKKSKFILGKSMGLSITLLTVFQSLARFIGPTCFSFGISVVNDINCTFEDHYVTNGCKLDGFGVSAICYICVSFLLMIIGSVYLGKKLGNNDSVLHPLVEV